MSVIPERTRGIESVDPVRMVWNRQNPEEVELAEKRFNDYIRSGWMAYTVNADKKKVQLFNFNPDLKEIFFIPLEEGG